MTAIQKTGRFGSELCDKIGSMGQEILLWGSGDRLVIHVRRNERDYDGTIKSG
jgi:hypothetical protein